MSDWVKWALGMAVSASVTYSGIRYDMGQMTANILSMSQRVDRLETRVYK